MTFTELNLNGFLELKKGENNTRKFIIKYTIFASIEFSLYENWNSFPLVHSHTDVEIFRSNRKNALNGI